MKRALQALPAVLLVLALIGIWELYVDLKGPTFSLILPPPHAVAKSLYTDRSLLWSSFLVTAQEVLLGILVATVFGFLLSIAIHFSPTLRRATYPLLGRFAGCAGRGLCSGARVLARLRDIAEARRCRGRILLLDRGHDDRGAGRRRSRPAQADADIRRLATDGRSGTSSFPPRFRAYSLGRRSRSRYP